MTFQEWTDRFLNSPAGNAAITLLDDTLGHGIDPSELDYDEGERPRPNFFYPSTPVYRDFKNMILAACFFADTCPLDPDFKAIENNTRQDMAGDGTSALNLIKKLRKLVKKHPVEFDGLFFFALLDAKQKDGIQIKGGPNKYHKLFDIILQRAQEHVASRNTPARFEEAKAANLFFNKLIERKRLNPAKDGLMYQLAFLIKDWCSGKREACALGYGQKLQHRGKAHPIIISAIVNATLRENITPHEVTQRLKDLKKCGAMLHAWPQEGGT